jgi:hypothetical protein
MLTKQARRRRRKVVEPFSKQDEQAEARTERNENLKRRGKNVTGEKK